MTSFVEYIYENEERTFCPFASFSKNTKGRQKSIDPCNFRAPYQRDRDRIIHAKSFRRLMYKTQVFLSPEKDHYRTRLTHTLEVSQIARTVARLLHLNEDLTEAISLGHDLGHTPFGHAGERVLDRLYEGGFTHNAQSLRVVDLLERAGEGLNLTYEVRDGILCHTGEKMADTCEGRIVRIADKIAFINHDIDDAIRGGILEKEDIPKHLRKILGENHGQRIDTMVRSLVSQTQKNFANGDASVRMEEEIFKATYELKDFMFANVYTNPKAKGEEGKACDVLESLYMYYVKNKDKIPSEYKKYMEKESVERAVCDYIASMTDRYALDMYEEIFLPKMWNK